MKKNESGRTVLEMLSVIVVVMILLMASVGGYNFLVQRQRRHQAVKDVVTMVTTLRVTEAARRYTYPQIIPARELVKGAKTDDNGQVLKLPDAEDSYAVVRALRNGGFTITLQAEKNTCDEILAALGERSRKEYTIDKHEGKTNSLGTARYLDNGRNAAKGVSYAKNWSDFAEKSEALTGSGEKVEWAKDNDGNAILATGAKLTLLDRIGCESAGGNGPDKWTAFLAVCEGGEYMCDGVCQKCPCHQQEDSKGSCCNTDVSLCDGMCECPKGLIAMREKGGCSCVECDGAKAQNVANADCVERADVLGLKDSAWWSAHACNKNINKCIECVEDSDCHESKYNPFSKRNEASQAGYGGDSLEKYDHLFCNKATNRCEECTTSYIGTVIRTGACPEGWPACVEGRCVRCPFGYDQETGKCKADCSKQQVAEGVPATGNACGTKKDILNLWKVEYDNETIANKVTEYCVPCYDSESGTGKDANCCGGRPICVDSAEGVSQDFIDGGTNENGANCYKCVDTNDNRVTERDGDEITELGDQDPDFGCSTGQPVCVGGSIGSEDEGKNKAGDTCVQCFENEHCRRNEICDENNRCKQTCPDGQYPCGTDANGAIKCCTCQDDKTGAGQDKGCGYTENEYDRLLCMPDGDETGNGTGKYGSICHKCQDDKDDYGAENKDSGCPTESPICLINENKTVDEDGTGKYGDNCAVCYDSDTSSDQDKGCSEEKPVCSDNAGAKDSPYAEGGTNEAGDICYECLRDEHCYSKHGGEKPVCSEDHVCVSCSDVTEGQRPVWNESESTPTEAACVYCNDDQAEETQDEGCPGVNEANNPTWMMCVPTGQETGNGTGASGEKCRKCQDNQRKADRDWGCEAETPICSDNEGSKDSSYAEGGTNVMGVVCYECLRDEHCYSKHGGEKPVCSKDHVCISCSDATNGQRPVWNEKESTPTEAACVYCNDDQAEAGEDEGCPGVNETNNPTWMMCVPTGQETGNGTGASGEKCRKCQDNQTGADEDWGCEAETPICVVEFNQEQQEVFSKDAATSRYGESCVKCYDDAEGKSQDTGCGVGENEGKPICSDDAGSEGSPYANGGTNTTGTACYECLENVHCSGGTPVCQNHICVSCAEATNGERPIWNATTKECVYCNDDKTGETQDEGCPGANETNNPTWKMCVPESGTENGPTAQGEVASGSRCRQCQDSEMAAVKDFGCNAEEPICVVEGVFNKDKVTGKYGESCVKCYDDATGKTQDTGCDAESPVCVGSDDAKAEWQNVDSKKPGTQCVFCYDSELNAGIDAGCDDKAPLCVISDSSHNNWVNDGLKTVGTQCIACYDSEEGFAIDEGCNGGEPICLTANKVNNGQKTKGNSCVQCLEDSDCTDKANNPVCEGNVCVPCSDRDSKTPVWNDKEKTCVYCNDNQEGETQDEGCPGNEFDSGLKMCVPTGNDTGNGTEASGNLCHRCQNNNYGKNGGSRDYGCPQNVILCEAGENEYSDSCRKCQDNEAGANTDWGCGVDSENGINKPICVVAGSFNKSAVTNKYGNSCAKCYDDAKGANVDTGCPDTTPFCSDDAGSLMYGYGESGEKGGTGNVGTACYECVDNDYCFETYGEAKPFCNNHVCTPCVCADGRSGEWLSDVRVCACCKDNQTGSNHDEGCDGSDRKWLCMPWNNPKTTENESLLNGSKKAGESCYVCQNNKATAETDNGCNVDDKPLCGVEELNAYGNECYKCQDTFKQETADDRADLGCPSDKRICSTTNAGTGAFANNCYQCLENPHCPGNQECQSYTCVCPVDKPYWDETDKMCYECLNDTHCSTDKPVCNDNHVCEPCPADKPLYHNGECTTCYDDVSGDSKDDAGCGSDKWNGLPICVTAGNKNDGTGTHGTSCGFCINDKDGAERDSGCKGAKAACDAPKGEFGESCVCPEGQIWNGEMCSVCFDTATEGSTDDGCGGSGTWKGKPICVTTGKVNNGQGTPGNSCAFCLNDKSDTDATKGGIDTGCSETQPLCDANAGEYGTKCKSCPSDKPVWNGKICSVCFDTATRGSTDNGCGTGNYKDKPICEVVGFVNEGKGAAGVRCAVCMNDEDGKTNDSGCPSTSNPMCAATKGQYGYQCAKCINDKSDTDAAKGGVDTGCSETQPLCDAGAGAYGLACKSCPSDKPVWNGKICSVCLDTATRGSTDNGCGTGNYKDKPICEVVGFVNEGKGAAGVRCAVCMNDEDGKTNDSGCPSTSNPMCAAAKGQYGYQCAKCINDKGDTDTVNGGVDTGCSEAQPLCDAGAGAYGLTCKSCPSDKPVWNGKTCVKCRDTATGGSTDSGCGANGKNICDVKDSNGNTQNHAGGGSGSSCVLCHNDKTGGTRDSGCPSNQPLCMAPQGWFGNGCTVCFDTATGGSKDDGCGAGGKNICDVKDSRGNTQNHAGGGSGGSCVLCHNDKTGDTRDSGCPSDTPLCNAPQGKFGNNCEKPCTGSDKCVDAAGRSGTVNACIPVNSYDDIKRGSDGKCECLASVGSEKVSDIGHSYAPGDGWDKTCERRQSRRELLYKIPVNFYCERYMHVSDNAQADDYVAGSNPVGIGKDSPAVKDTSWRKAHDNSISPRVSSTRILKGDAYLLTSDRWLRETGFDGYFYFTTGKSTKGSTGKLKVKISWNSGSSKSSPIGGWVTKVGEGKCGSSSGSSSRSSTCSHKKCGSHISHAWIKARAPNCRDCGTNKHEKADSDNKKTPHTHYYCYCDTCSCP